MSNKKTLAVIDAVVQSPDGSGRDLINQLLGQAQAFQAAGDLLRTFGVSKLAFVKENKLYQQLSGMRTPNGSELSGTWVEFCGLLGVSDDKANEDIANLRVFGEEALEQMQRVGMGYRELRQFRRLPADEHEALIEAAATGDKDTLLDLAETIIARHTKEKAELVEQVDSLEASQADIAADRDSIAAERDGALKRLNKRNQRDEDDEGVPVVMADLRAEMAALVKKAELAIAAMHPVGVEAVGYSGHDEAGVWVVPTLRMGLSGLLAVRELVDGSITSYVQAMGEKAERLASRPDALAFLSDAEIKDVAEQYASLIATHSYEADLRKHERNAARPQGKGRPANAPEAPSAAKPGKAKKAKA